MKNILDFLSKLSENNSREWMEKNKVSYQDTKKSFEEIVQKLIDKIALFDSSVSGIAPKDCIFRIFRDVRFSKNKLPYKTNMGAFISSIGKKSENGGYYIHIEPGASMLAGGVYMPSADVLKKIRQEIDYNPSDLIAFIQSNTFKTYFGKFEGEALKRPPKGYPDDHPQVDLLKLKSYIVVHNISDQEITKPGFIDYSVKIFKEIKPLNDYISLANSN